MLGEYIGFLSGNDELDRTIICLASDHGQQPSLISTNILDSSEVLIARITLYTYIQVRCSLTVISCTKASLGTVRLLCLLSAADQVDLSLITLE